MRLSKSLTTAMCAITLIALFSGCAQRENPNVQSGPRPSAQKVVKLTTFELRQMSPEYPPTADLSHKDLRSLDLSAYLEDLLNCTFDSKTAWPRRLPPGFDPKTILSLGKSPGLGLTALHREGITGEGVGIGIIDQNLLVDHIEYKDRVRFYKEIDLDPIEEASMHGAAVASLAAGKSVGVAPEADLYYVAAPQAGRDFERIARCVDELLQVNEGLSADSKIRVISISMGPKPDEKGYADIMDAIRRADEAGVFVVTCSTEDTHSLKFHGLGRAPLSDPDDALTYTAGCWWDSLPDLLPDRDTMLVPMDSRTVAAPTGVKDYRFDRLGGWSWSVPYIAGLYALACQVNPDVTPSSFWETALNTGFVFAETTPLGAAVEGRIVNPGALIEALSK